MSPRISSFLILLILGWPISSVGQDAAPARAIEPTLVFSRSEFVLGEPISFLVARKAPEPVSPMALMNLACELSVHEPNGRKVFTKTIQGLVVYDGPGLLRSMGSMEFLNDMVSLGVGNYRVVHACGNRNASRDIILKDDARWAKLALSFAFPPRLDPSGKDPLRIDVGITNGLNERVQLVAVGSNYLASPVGVLDVPSGPTRVRLQLQPVDNMKVVNYGTPISQSNIERLSLVELAPGETYRTSVSFDNPFPRLRVSLAEVVLTLGLVEPVFTPQGELATHLFHRAKACYDGTGQRKASECAVLALDWGPILPNNLRLD